MSVVDPSLLVTSAPRREVSGVQLAIAGSLVVFVAVRLAAVDETAWTWYESLRRPGWAGGMPALVGVGWLVATGASVAAAELVATARTGYGALVAWSAQAVLLVAWVWLLFWNGSVARAFVAVFALVIVASVTTVGFFRVSRWAGLLALPALVWAAAAMLLTGGLVVLN